MKYSSSFVAVKHAVLQAFDNKLCLFYTIFNRESIKKLNNGKQQIYLLYVYTFLNIFNILDTLADSISNARHKYCGRINSKNLDLTCYYYFKLTE